MALRCRHRLPRIDIEDHDESPTIVAQVNDDNLTVPTVLFRDGSALTNPSAAQVGSRLV
jgi:mycoredoxin